MSYSIYIGEATITYDLEETVEHAAISLRLHVPEIENKDAPCFDHDTLSQYNNGRHPAYTTWHDFTKAVGFYDIWYNEYYGILRPHPGIKLLTEPIVKIFQSTRDDYKKRYPSAKPRMMHSTQDAHLARLEWLVWWTEYTLGHCRIPAICNH